MGVTEQGFVIESYDQKKAFTSFLPGIAGLKGIPLWCFYTNRGQGVCSFGIDHKDNAIMEFFPAQQGYQYVDTYGFRTFIQLDDEKIIECFSRDRIEGVTRTMTVMHHGFTIEEVDQTQGYKIKVTYFGLPGEAIGALVRKVTLENFKDTRPIKLLDGMANILPYGVESTGFKAMGNLMRSWMDVEHLESKVPFFKVRTSMADTVEVSLVEKGHFYMAFRENGELIQPIVDPKIIFGENTGLSQADGFGAIDFQTVNHHQYTANKVPCAFAPTQMTMQTGDVVTLVSVIGHCAHYEWIQALVPSLCQHNFIGQKEVEAKALLDTMLQDIDTQTDVPLWDAYLKQSYLDNLLRGGYPITLKGHEKSFAYYVYGRKHGDPEREYNFFRLAPEFYSNGEGNFRDVNQNRRCDILFHPELGTKSIVTFMNLIQLDGYNPLIVENDHFKWIEDVDLDALLTQHLEIVPDGLKHYLSHGYTPGGLVTLLEKSSLVFRTSQSELIGEILDGSLCLEGARHGEGFWSDHFTYNLDLIESYLKVFPDRLTQLLFLEKNYRYYESPERVLPRDSKLYLTENGTVRQYGSVVKDQEKISRLGMDSNGTNWVKIQQGKGCIYETFLFEKLLALSLTKMTLLDPEGMGMEMEANKPGWNDALNGLPGLLGSGLSETIETKRIIDFLITSIKSSSPITVALPIELIDLWQALNEALRLQEDVQFWKACGLIREAYREKIRFGLDGQQHNVMLETIMISLEVMSQKLKKGIDKAITLGKGLPLTFFTYQVTDYDVIADDFKREDDYAHLKRVRPNRFICEPLAPFLEAPARYLKSETQKNKALAVHQMVKASGIYDPKLAMYKTSASIEHESHEIGRLRAFTAGWLERESVFLHMTYKYLLGLLEAGLYEAFYEAFYTNCVAFLDSEVYGRSVLENSSFIASSVNPDPFVHGQGFVARLSGSNAEVLSIWHHMMIGKGGFTYSDQLTFIWSPVLAAKFFEKSGQVVFNFLSNTRVTYHNPERKDTFGIDCVHAYKIQLIHNGETKIVQGDRLDSTLALALRAGAISEVNVFFKTLP